MKTHQKIAWLLIIALAATSCSKKEECDPNDKESACYAGLGGNQVESECSYKVTIDGQTTFPNQYGQDKMVIQSHQSQNTFVFTLNQAKVNPKESTILTFMLRNTIDAKTPIETTYPVAGFQTTPLSQASLSHLTVYGYAVDQKDYGSLTFTLIEFSDQRIRMKISGKVMKLDQIGDEISERGLVPVELEITVGRKYYNEYTINGNFVGAATCDCQKL